MFFFQSTQISQIQTNKLKLTSLFGGNGMNNISNPTRRSRRPTPPLNTTVDAGVTQQLLTLETTFFLAQLCVDALLVGGFNPFEKY